MPSKKPLYPPLLAPEPPPAAAALARYDTSTPLSNSLPGCRVTVVAVDDDDLRVDALDRLGRPTSCVPYVSSKLHDCSVPTAPIHSILHTVTHIHTYIQGEAKYNVPT